MEKMTILPDAVFKDASPMATVERIRRILQQYSIEVKENWNESNVPHCFSLRLDVNGTAFSVNGKGISKEFALASAYGELMERMQLGYIFKGDQQKSNVATDSGNDVRMPVEEVLRQHPKWYDSLATGLKTYTGVVMTPEEILKRFVDADGTVGMTSYYCITSGKQEYFPTGLRKSLYSTNGCAAGNTMEEALVQAISEIVERYFKLQILSERIPLPEIPEEVLRDCPVAYSIITYLRSNGFQVRILDCSMGTKFPVVCVCLVDRKNGRYHTHFGAYPNFEIALQRTLTETFQGRNIASIAKHEEFCNSPDDVYALKYLMAELVKGTSEKLPSFFVNTAKEPYQQTAGFFGKGNRALLRECVEFFREMGFDVLVRDGSSLGFPTYQVIVPGCSEVFLHRLSEKNDDVRYHQYARKTLRNPTTAKLEDMIGFLKHMTEIGKDNPDSFGNFLGGAGIPAEISLADKLYYMNAVYAYVSYTLGRRADAVKYIGNMIAKGPETHREYLVCVKRYLTLQMNRYPEAEIRRILEYFHQEQSVQKLYDCLASRKNPLETVVLRCDLQCHPDCLLYSSCTKKKTDALSKMISDKLAQLDFSDIQNRMTKIMK